MVMLSVSAMEMATVMLSVMEMEMELKMQSAMVMETQTAMVMETQTALVKAQVLDCYFDFGDHPGLSKRSRRSYRRYPTYFQERHLVFARNSD
jgi:hypothetical protein